MAKRDLRAAHRTQQAERAGALDLDDGARHAQRLAQPLVGRQLQGGPGGRQGERHGHGAGDVGQRSQPTAPVCLGDAGQRRGEQAERPDQLERPARHHQEQEPEDAERAAAGAEQIGPIDTRDRLDEARERDADAHGAAEERHEQDRVQGAQIQQLAGVPDQLERVERQPLCDREARDRGDAEQRRESGERGGRARFQTLARQRQEGAARAVAEQRDADHHVGEVIPLDDREQAREQHLVREHAGRDQADREQAHGLGDRPPELARYRPRSGTRAIAHARRGPEHAASAGCEPGQRRYDPRVSGTNLTGKRLAGAHPAVGVLLDQHQMLQGKAAAHGITMVPPGFSCWIKGGGT